MLIIPAIDIKNGNCVRLTQGKFDQEVIYSENPIQIAKTWQKQGAKMIHLVDLDGAKNGKMTNLKVIKDILATVNIPVQVGGGIRDEKSIKKLLALGVNRIILGSILFGSENLLKTLLSKYQFQIIIALDAKNGVLMKEGWLESTNKNLIKTAEYLEKLGVKRLIYTDVYKDGTMTSPNYDVIRKLLKTLLVPLIVAGGISSPTDIQKLKGLGVEGIIIGKALYEGKIKLQEVVKC